MDSPSRHLVDLHLLPLLGASPTFEFTAEQRDSLGAPKRSLAG